MTYISGLIHLGKTELEAILFKALHCRVRVPFGTESISYNFIYASYFFQWLTVHSFYLKSLKFIAQHMLICIVVGYLRGCDGASILISSQINTPKEYELSFILVFSCRCCSCYSLVSSLCFKSLIVTFNSTSGEQRKCVRRREILQWKSQQLMRSNTDVQCRC